MYEQLIEVFNAQLPLDEGDKTLLREYFFPQEIPRKARLIEFDRIAERFYFINRGLLRLYGYQEGEEKTLFFFRENMIAGSLESYLYQKPSGLILEALEDTETLAITGDGLQALYEVSPKFSRIGRFIMPGIFDGKHHFELIETRADQVRLVQYEHFSGILAGMMLRKIEDQTREGFRKMNQALKERSEARYLAEK